MRSFKLPRITMIFVFILWFVTMPSLAQTNETVELPKSKIELTIEFTNDSALTYKNRLIELVDTALAEYTNLFGGPPKKLNGDAYDKLTIKLTKRSKGLGGEADPEYIDLRVSETKVFGFYDWEMAVLHEVLHLWSAETFRYADDQDQWFNEGVTEYLAQRLAAKLGIIKQEEILSIFSRPIGTYLSAKGVGELSLRNAGGTDKLKKEHFLLVYHGGFVVGMVLDHQIRSKSKGKFSLDTLMSELYRTHSRKNPYSSSSILKLIKQSMNLDFDQFFERHVYGNQIIPVGQYFDIGALSLSQRGKPITEERQKVLFDMLTFK